MTKRNMKPNLRQAARWRCDHLPITWERNSKRRRRPGWLSDISELGLCYVAARTGAPHPGDHIAITPRRSSDTIHARVVRVRPQSHGLCSVGCQRLSGVESPAGIVPDTDAHHGRRRAPMHRPHLLAA